MTDRGGEDKPAYDQRLGKRRPLDSAIDGTWPVARKARLRTKVEDEPISIVNVSPTGIGLLARPVPDAVVGVRTRVDLDGSTCQVVVRRIEHVSDDLAYDGVRFAGSDPAFIDHLLERAGAPAREKLESYWNSAD